MPRLITKISCTWSVMETVQAFLKVSKLANKGQFERYSIRYLPKFISVNELKQYLLENYSEELSPASRRKCDIKTEKQLDDPMGGSTQFLQMKTGRDRKKGSQ